MATKSNAKKIEAVQAEASPAAPQKIDTHIEGETVLQKRRETADNSSKRGQVTGLRRILTTFANENKADIADRMSFVQTVSQRLAEASDLYNEGDGRHNEAATVADKAAISLYRARIDNKITKDDVSQILRDVFGAKRKGGGGRVSSTDPEASKTPFGKGEDIRKRVVRACDAFACAQGDEDNAGAFFVGLDGESDDKDGTTLNEVLLALEEETTSIWTAYEAFASIKRNHQERTEMAFDPKKVSAMVASLSSDQAAEIITNNPSLKAAYTALLEVLDVIGEEPSTEKPVLQAAE